MLWNYNNIIIIIISLGQGNKLNFITSFSKINDYTSSRDRVVIFAIRITVSFQDKIKWSFSCTTLSLFFRCISKMQNTTISLVMSVCPSTWSNSAQTGRMFMKSDISVFRKSFQKIQVSLKFDNNNRYFTWRPVYIYYNISLNSF
jgi:hypothetical protein